MKSLIRISFISSLTMGMLFLGGCNTYDSVYDSIGATEVSRMNQRTNTNNLQVKAINKKMNACLFGDRGWFNGTGEIAQQVRYITNNAPFSKLTAKDITNLTDDAEKDCTANMLDTVAVGNPKGATALAALLEENNYSLSEDYQKAAKKDDVALVSVHF